MTTPSRSGSERLYRLLLRAYPRSFRHDFGEETVRLVRDRRVHDREPLWRLWPSLLHDTARNAVVVRWEDLMSTNRAIVVAGLVTLALVAALAVGPLVALPILVAIGFAARTVWRRQQPAEQAAAPRSWRRWLVGGVLLFAVGFGYLLAFGEEELAAPEWALVAAGFVLGLFVTSTGLVLFVTGRRRPLTS